jgi:hypothetical protein
MNFIEQQGCQVGRVSPSAPRPLLPLLGERAGVRAGVLLVLLTILNSAAAPQIAWTARYSFGTNSDSKVFALALDPQQNLIVAGTSKNEQGNYDYVAAKYSPGGSTLWLLRSDSGGADEVRGLAVDSEGNVVLTGTSLTVKYGTNSAPMWTAPYGGRGVAIDGSNNVVVTGFSEDDFATVKLTPQGSNVWVRYHDRIGRPDIAKAVTVDQAGNVYVAGTQTWMFDRLYCCYSTFYVLKYDAEGNQQWIQGIDENKAYRKESEVKGLLVHTNGNVVFTGNGRGPVNCIYCTAMFTNTGQRVWIRNYSPTDGAGAEAMTLDPSGHAFVTGGVYGWLEDEHIYFKTFKIDSSGATIWESTYSSVQGPSVNQANAICLDGAGNGYVAGQSTGLGTASDWATIKYNSSGQEQWVVRYDGLVHGEDQATALVVDNSGAIYVGGFTTTTNGIEMLVIKYVEVQPIQVQTNQTVLLEFLGAPGQSNRVQGTTDFFDWLELGFSLADTNGLLRFLDTNAPGFPFRFYRVLSP